jgi:hypothetical protein
MFFCFLGYSHSHWNETESQYSYFLTYVSCTKGSHCDIAMIYMVHFNQIHSSLSSPSLNNFSKFHYSAFLHAVHTMYFLFTLPYHHFLFPDG